MKQLSVRKYSDVILVAASALASHEDQLASLVTQYGPENVLVDGVEVSKLNQKPAETVADEPVLIGSSIQPAIIKVGEAEVQLGDVVAKAHEDSGLTAAEWNAQEEAAREAAIAAAITAHFTVADDRSHE
jgi:hypothetical protein